MANKSADQATKIGSWADPTFAKNSIKEMAARAERGDKEAAEKVFLILEQRPDLKVHVPEVSDLGSRVISKYIKAIAGPRLLTERALQEEIAAMKARMLEPSASVLEQLMTTVVLRANLEYAGFADRFVETPQSAAEPQSPDRQLDAAQRRFLAALNAWRQVLEKKSCGLSVPDPMLLATVKSGQRPASRSQEGTNGRSAKRRASSSKSRPQRRPRQ
ncbi:MAG TPA: hypothetical protein VH120_04325 [Gemmataceae bacterium]|jgi:hypothetical protein|nr:hypothetical protein [Gemmataceae bacterium]